MRLFIAISCLFALVFYGVSELVVVVSVCDDVCAATGCAGRLVSGKTSNRETGPVDSFIEWEEEKLWSLLVDCTIEESFY